MQKDHRRVRRHLTTNRRTALHSSLYLCLNFQQEHAECTWQPQKLHGSHSTAVAVAAGYILHPDLLLPVRSELHHFVDMNLFAAFKKQDPSMRWQFFRKRCGLSTHSMHVAITTHVMHGTGRGASLESSIPADHSWQQSSVQCFAALRCR